ncbi:MAG: hypothetical protein WCH34_18255 [Bacteroidota bacterium]
MNTEIKKIDIQEKDLELVVSEKTLGSLTTNAKQIKALVEQQKTVTYTAPVIPTQQPESTTLTRAFKVTASKELIIELGDFMNQKGIIFEKIEL